VKRNYPKEMDSLHYGLIFYNLCSGYSAVKKQD